MEDTIKLALYWIENAIKSMEGDVEQFSVILDRTDTQRKNVDLELIKKMISIFSDYYPERLGQTFVLKADWVFYTIWAIIKWFLDAELQVKLLF